MIIKKKFNLFINNAMKYSFPFYLAPFVILSAIMVGLILSGYNFSSFSYYIIHYIYTYRHGYISRGLIGEVISWFVEIVTPRITAIVVIIGSFLFISAASVCIGFALNRVKHDKYLFSLVFWVIVILCLSPFTFRSYLTSVKIDKFVWAVALFAMPLLASKKAIWFIPPLCVLAIVINPVFLFTSMIILAIPLLQKLYDENYSKKMKAICIVTYTLLIIVGIASAVSEKFVGFENAEEMVRFYFSRYRDQAGASVVNDEMIQSYSDTLLLDYFVPFSQFIPVAFKAYFLNNDNVRSLILNFIFYILPIEALCIAFWRICIKSTQKKFQKFIFLVCILSPIVAIPPCILSWEISKYFSNSCFAQTCIFLYFVLSKNEAVLCACKKVEQFVKNNMVVSAITVAYILLLFSR